MGLQMAKYNISFYSPPFLFCVSVHLR
jgi:hypothetical protein